MRFSLRWLSIGLVCFAVLFGLRLFAVAGLLFCTLGLAFAFELVSGRLAARSRTGNPVQSNRARRYWHSHRPPAIAIGLPGPLHVIVIYLVLVKTWNMLFAMILPASTYGMTIGEEFRFWGHIVNGGFLAYVMVVLCGMVSTKPRCHFSELIAMAFAALAVGAVHLFIMLSCWNS